jgi:hypothetical protein
MFKMRTVVATAMLALVFPACGGDFTPTDAAPLADIQTVGNPVTFCMFTTCNVTGTIVNQGPDCASTVLVNATATESGRSLLGIRTVSTEPQTVGPLAVGASASINVCCFAHTYPRVTFAAGATPVRCR